MKDPVLYSFRRCPYCIRAHMGLKKAGIRIELREVSLKALPREMLAISADKTVPLLSLPDGTVYEESWDILKWALAQNDPDNWLGENRRFQHAAEMLVANNDSSFKRHLDHYKYADRHPAHSQEYYRRQCEQYLAKLEDLLAGNGCLLSEQLSIADIAVFPFIRQFSLVDSAWFEQSDYINLRHWLQNLIDTELFHKVFQKHKNWQPGDRAVYL